jgi:hypothetical protein
MQQHVGIAVTHEMPAVRHVNAAKPQRATAGQTMGIVPDTNS